MKDPPGGAAGRPNNHLLLNVPAEPDGRKRAVVDGVKAELKPSSKERMFNRFTSD